jgi:hydrogenase maturation protease
LAFILHPSSFILSMKVLVLGLGNPLLGDDGVGWRVVEELGSRVTDPPVELDVHSGGGLSLMERLVGYDRAILVDAINTGSQPQGTIDCFQLQDLPTVAQSHLASAHETTLQNALQLGRTIGASLPKQVRIIAIEAKNVYDFSEELSPEVALAVPIAVEKVISQLGN